MCIGHLVSSVPFHLVSLHIVFSVQCTVFQLVSSAEFQLVSLVQFQLVSSVEFQLVSSVSSNLCLWYNSTLCLQYNSTLYLQYNSSLRQTSKESHILQAAATKTPQVLDSLRYLKSFFFFLLQFPPSLLFFVCLINETHFLF